MNKETEYKALSDLVLGPLRDLYGEVCVLRPSGRKAWLLESCDGLFFFIRIHLEEVGVLGDVGSDTYISYGTRFKSMEPDLPYYVIRKIRDYLTTIRHRSERTALRAQINLATAKNKEKILELKGELVSDTRIRVQSGSGTDSYVLILNNLTFEESKAVLGVFRT